MAEALIILGVALNVVFWVVTLVFLARDRRSVELRKVVKWGFLLALVPGLGVLGLSLERSESYEVFFLVMLVALMVLGLVLVVRDRHSMRTRDFVKWAILVVLLPGFGALGYFFWRLENVVQRGTPHRRDRPAPFLRSPFSRSRR